MNEQRRNIVCMFYDSARRKPNVHKYQYKTELNKIEFI